MISARLASVSLRMLSFERSRGLASTSVCCGNGGGCPGAGEGEDFFAGPRGAVAVEEFVDGGGGEAPVDGEEEDRRGEEDEKDLRDKSSHVSGSFGVSWHGRLARARLPPTLEYTGERGKAS